MSAKAFGIVKKQPKDVAKLFVMGCDPELMVIDKKSGVLQSAIPLMQGSKHKPQQLEDGAALSDNVMVEYNTKPANDAKEFVAITMKVLKQISKLVGDKNSLLVRASADFPDEALSDPRAKEFGCDPDFNAWALCINTVEVGAAQQNFRSAGGHVHIGKTPVSEKLLDSEDGKIRVVKAMDTIAGITSVIIDKDPTSMARRNLYGRAGCNRPKPYGVEYRALGNFWVKSPRLATLIYGLTEFAVKLCLEDKEQKLIDKIGADVIQRVINESDKSAAKTIFKNELVKILPKELTKEIHKIENQDFDFYKEWSLT